MTEMVDMARFIEAKSDQLNADDLIGGVAKTLKVTKVTGTDGDQPVSIFYEGDGGKPFKPCKTIRRVLMGVWGRYAQEYVGRTMVVYRDDKVQFGGLEVGGIRISHMSHIDKETIVVVMKSKGKKVAYKVLPLTNAPAPTNGNGRAKAEQWLAGYLANPVQSPANDRALAKLKEQHPDLYELALNAAASQDDDDPFGLPAIETPPPSSDASPVEQAAPTPQPATEEAPANGGTSLHDRMAALNDPPAGKPDEERGEATTLADACNEIAGLTSALEIGTRVSALKPLLSEEEGDELASYAGKRIDELTGGR